MKISTELTFQNRKFFYFDDIFVDICDSWILAYFTKAKNNFIKVNIFVRNSFGSLV